MITLFKMDNFKTKYESVVGKFESLYVYVLFDCSLNQIIEHIKDQKNILKRMKDIYKQKLYISRYTSLLEYIENLDKELNDKQNKSTSNQIRKYNNIFFVGETIEHYDLTKLNIKLLKQCKHKNIDYVYGDKFNLDFLNDLINNDKFYHVFQCDNKYNHYYQITKHKKNIIIEKSSINDIKLFINKCIDNVENFDINDKYIIHGNNQKLKTYQDKKALIISSFHLKDNDIIEMIDKIKNDLLIDEFLNDLEMINDNKKMHRIIFKKDIYEDFFDYQIEKIYVNKQSYYDITKNDELFDKIKNSSCHIIEIDSDKLSQYGNIVGVTYY